MEERIGNVPCVLALNKADLENWNVDEETIERFKELGWDVFETSAKEGAQVESLFHSLVAKLNK